MPLSREPRARVTYADEVDQKGGFTEKIRDRDARSAAKDAQAAADAAQDAADAAQDAADAAQDAADAAQDAADEANAAIAALATPVAINALADQRGTAIPVNSDLNDYKTPGSYYVQNSTTALTLSNCPDTNSNARLEVIQGGSENFRYQLYYLTGSSSLAAYTRYYHPTNDAWTAWSQIINDKIVPKEATATPLVDGTAAVGTSAKYAREDHVHPTNVSDSGWLYLNYTSPFANHSDNTANRPAYRKYGKVVQIRGAATVTEQIPADTTQRTMFTLPSGYRPSLTQYFLCQGTNYNKWMLSVSTNGNVTHSRYGGTSGATTNVGNWLPFSATFLVD